MDVFSERILALHSKLLLLVSQMQTILPQMCDVILSLYLKISERPCLPAVDSRVQVWHFVR